MSKKIVASVASAAALMAGAQAAPAIKNAVLVHAGAGRRRLDGARGLRHP